MTPDETVGLLAHMVVAWPTQEVHPAATEMWIRHLADVDVADGRAAFDRLVASEEWPPTVARFLAESAAVARARPVPPALPMARTPLPEARAGIAEARRALRP